MSEVKFPCEKHDVQISNLEKRFDAVEDKIGNFSDMSNAITRLVTLQEESEKHNKQRDKEMERQSQVLESQSKALISLENTLVKINYNLDGLNTEIGKTNNRIGKLEEKVNEQSITNIKKFSWDFIDFIKSGIGVLIGGGIVYYITRLIK